MDCRTYQRTRYVKNTLTLLPSEGLGVIEVHTRSPLFKLLGIKLRDWKYLVKNNRTRTPVRQKDMGVQRRTAQSLTEFVEIVENIALTTRAGLWFRGQSNAGYRLTPGVLRHTTQVTDGLKRPIKEGQIVNASGGVVIGMSAEVMLEAFKRQARPFLEWVPANDFEWMFVAQHHGLPTRLLDWSTNALAALFFAASGAEEREGCGDTICEEFLNNKNSEFCDEGCAVFVIDPGAVNKAIHDVSDPIDIAADCEAWDEYLAPATSGLNAYAPVCVVAPHISSRIRAQSGTFTLHGSNIHPIDYYDVLRPMITKIFIPFTATKNIMRGLSLSGVNHSFIYPGLDSIARDITEAEGTRFSSMKSMHFDALDTSSKA